MPGVVRLVGKTYREEEVTDVVGDVDRYTHVREVEAVAKSNEGERNNMVSHEFFEIFPRLFQQQTEHNGLLSPITCLQQVIRLEQTFMASVRESFEHARGIEVPNGRSRHNQQAEWSKNAKIHRRIHLFHESVLLGAGLDAKVDCQGPNEPLHQEFAGERKDNDMECDKGEIKAAFAIIGAIGLGMVRQ